MKKQIFSSGELGLLSGAYMDKLFPRSKKGEMYSKLVDVEGSCAIYFSNEYHQKLDKHIRQKYYDGAFSNSNAEQRWINLMLKINAAIDTNEEIFDCQLYWTYETEEEVISENIDFCNYTYEFGSIEDIEGNIYKTIKIGNQIWMTENLKTTKYNNGEKIPIISNNFDWSDSECGACCWFDNDIERKEMGALYNWYAADKNICPNGWHVPTDEEWTELVHYLTENRFTYDGSNGYSCGNKIAKSIAYCSGWKQSFKVGTVGFKQDDNNSSQFSAKPGGFRMGGKFSDDPESSVFWWSKTPNNGMGNKGQGAFATAPSLGFDDYALRFNSYAKTFGCYIRCVKDNE